MPALNTNIGKLRLKNPVMVASGTFGYAEEFKDFLNLRRLGAVVTKTITLKPRQGNPNPRTCETPAGMLNSIGLENPGIDGFIEEKLPILKKIGVPIIVSIASEDDPDEFVELARRLDKIKDVTAIELNISCPNIKGNSSEFIVHSKKLQTPDSKLQSKLIAQDSKATYEVIKVVRQVTDKTLITKLSPNVTDITEIASAAERAGSNVISLINTLTGMSIDPETKKPKIASITGGLSGPAIRPVAVRMVREVYQKIKIPIIGMGGIIDTPSALEFFLAGASAIAIGTGNFINPRVSLEIIGGLKKYMAQHKVSSIRELVGSLKI